MHGAARLGERGLRSRSACASPLALAATPGPRVERTAPGAPVSSPVTAAMMQAAASWWHRTKGRSCARAASSSSRLEPPPGTPKRRCTPARRRPSMSTSATVSIRSARAGSEAAAGVVLAGEAGEHGAHPVQGLPEIGLRVGVGEPEIALAVLSEGRAPEDGHATFLQDRLGNLRRGPLERLDVREDVEGALGRPAGHAGESVEPGHDDVAPPLELGDHPLHRRLILLERGDARPL